MIYASRTYLKATSREIGEEFGGIGPAAISMQCRGAEEEIRKKRGCHAMIQELENILNCQLKT